VKQQGLKEFVKEEEEEQQYLEVAQNLITLKSNLMVGLVPGVDPGVDPLVLYSILVVLV